MREIALHDENIKCALLLKTVNRADMRGNYLFFKLSFKVNVFGVAKQIL